MKKALIIDGNSIVNRAFFGIKGLSNKDGFPTNGIYGFLTILNKMREELKPDFIAVAFDMKAPTFRHGFYEGYKGTRKGMPDELRVQMPVLKEFLDAMGIMRLEIEGFEADDLIGTVARVVSENNGEAYILTGDRDALSLIEERIFILYHGNKENKLYNAQIFEDEYGLVPAQMVDLKGLMGDTSDNIPGIPNVGKVTATKLLQQFGTLENLLLNTKDVSNLRIRTLLEENAEMGHLSKRLAQIHTFVPIEFSISELEPKEEQKETLLTLYKQYNFQAWYKKQLETNRGDHEHVVREVQTISKRLKDLIDSQPTKLALSIAYDSAPLRRRVAHSLMVSTAQNKHFLMDDPAGFDMLKPLLEDPNIHKIGQDIKQIWLILKNYGITLEGMTFDGLIAAYLIEPQRKSYALSELAMEYVNQMVPTIETVWGKGAAYKKCADCDSYKLHQFLCEQNVALFKLEEALRSLLIEKEMLDLFETMEMPLVEVLANMEYEGFYVDQKTLDALDVEISGEIERLIKAIYESVGHPFNINSPKQLGEILFEELKLTAAKKTKTGYSTDHDTLMKLVDAHPVVYWIMEYRTYSKLKSTYVDGLRAVIDPDTGRIHSSLNQTVAATGRLSSTEPNLQNIPVRLEMGRKLRKIFVPRDADHTLCDADYSQIELRVLAHMTGDPGLKQAYLDDYDIHAMTASQIFDIPMSSVTGTERSKAKEINFGVVYGMSEFGLSESLKITRKMAKQYIDNYFIKYPLVKTFMNEVIENCKIKGYVETISGRKRPIPEINSSNFNLRAYGERMAMNTPVQGSAADVIKAAMIKVYRELKAEGLQSQLILQVHDELIIDAVKDEILAVEALLERCMTTAYPLSVPLKIDMKTGDSWYDTK
jgi:DNA polymerase-1